MKFTHAGDIGVCSLMLVSVVYSARLRSSSVLTGGDGGEVCLAWGSLVNSLLLSCLFLSGEAWTLNAVRCKAGGSVMALRGGASLLVTFVIQYLLYVVLVGLPDPFVCLVQLPVWRPLARSWVWLRSRLVDVFCHLWSDYVTTFSSILTLCLFWPLCLNRALTWT